jgi:DNA-binding SARP family transcriptional activator
MKYRKRNPDGTFGEWVETPAHQPEQEFITIYEVLAYQDMELNNLRQEIEDLKAEIQAMKGGGNQ